MKNSIIQENKKSVTVFFCDVYGTIDGGFTDKDCQQFAELLKKIAIKNGSDYLFFRMLSTERPETIKYYEESLSKYFQDNIMVMNKIYTNEVSHAAKLSCAMECLQNLQKEYNIDEVYCADDIDFLQEIFRNILKETMGINLNVIIPKYGENNLKFINEEIENRFIKTNIKR